MIVKPKKVEVDFEEKNGRTYSRRKEFCEKGNLIAEGLYGKGNAWEWSMPIGKIKRYYSNGKPLSEEHYDEHGQREGESLYFHHSGYVEQKHYYEKDKKIREQFFDHEGRVLADKEFK